MKERGTGGPADRRHDAHLDRIEEARASVQTGLALNPDFTLSHFRASAPTDNPTCLAQRARIAEGMRKAGLPEG